jgi:hypothetical protein
VRGETWPTTTQRLLKATRRPRWRGGASSAMYTGTTLEARPTAMPTIMRPATWQVRVAGMVRVAFMVGVAGIG